MEETKTLQEEYSPTEAKREKVRRVAVAMIDDFPEHPFKVKDDEEMEKLLKHKGRIILTIAEYTPSYSENVLKSMDRFFGYDNIFTGDNDE